jgi:alpha-D-ribose 1-methylphosphonate 5-phosphate C-P lyase
MSGLEHAEDHPDYGECCFCGSPDVHFDESYVIRNGMRVWMCDVCAEREHEADHRAELAHEYARSR